MFAPSLVLATIGVLLTAALTAPAAKYVLGLGWLEALLVGAVVASTDAAAVFFLVHAGGLRLRPRVGATLEVESGTRDVAVPDDFAAALAALAAQPAARAFFDGLAPGQRSAFVTPITGAKAADTRRRRIDKAVAALTEGKKRV